MKQQVLIVAISMDDFKSKARPFMEQKYLIVPESLRIAMNDTEAVIAAIMEKEE